MPSFDTVSNPTWSRCKNAVDQTAKEIGTRFDFKGTVGRASSSRTRRSRSSATATSRSAR